MVRHTPPNLISDFQRGFAHLALRSPVANLAILPVAIASSDERLISSRIPLKLLSFSILQNLYLISLDGIQR